MVSLAGGQSVFGTASEFLRYVNHDPLMTNFLAVVGPGPTQGMKNLTQTGFPTLIE